MTCTIDASCWSMRDFQSVNDGRLTSFPKENTVTPLHVVENPLSVYSNMVERPLLGKN